MKVIFITVLLGMLVAPAVAAQRGVCAPDTEPVTLDFQTLKPAPVYNNSLNIDGIRALFREHTGTVNGPHQRALGVTYALTSFSLRGSTVVKQVRGGYCIYVESVEAVFGWKHMDVYIASEFQPGTCEYRTIRDHENQHVGANNDTLKEYAPHFRAALEQALAGQQPIFSTAMPPNGDASFEVIQRRMSGYLEQFQTLMATRNAPLDSASNYGETAKLCSNWDGVGPPKGR